MPKILIISLLSAFLIACGSSTKTIRQIDSAQYYSNIKITNKATAAPSHFLAAVKSHLISELRKSGRYGAAGGNNVLISVNSYRMRSDFNRLIFGVFAGKDGIDSNVTVRNSRTGQLIGSSTISSFNSTTMGSMDTVARLHAEEIAKFLLGKVKKTT